MEWLSRNLSMTKSTFGIGILMTASLCAPAARADSYTIDFRGSSHSYCGELRLCWFNLENWRSPLASKPPSSAGQL
jgi:hypothetical protein